MAERRRLPFLIALFLAPALLGLVIGGFSLLGDYGSRFGLAGALGLVSVLPAWFTAYFWLAWRDPPVPGMKPRVKASLAANFASLVIFPAIIMALASTGQYDAIFADTAIADVAVTAQEGTPEFPEVPSPRDASIAAAVIAFLLGLVFLPMLAAIFAWVERKVGSTAPAP